VERQIFGSNGYLIEINAPGAFKFYASRRYNEFNALHESLKMKFQHIQ